MPGKYVWKGKLGDKGGGRLEGIYGEYALSGNDCSAKFMGYFNKGTGAYSYPLHGASAGKPPVAPASNQYITYTHTYTHVCRARGVKWVEEESIIMGLPICFLPACLPVYLSVYLADCLFPCLSVCICLLASLFVKLKLE